MGIQPLARTGQRPELSQATGMALVRCILGKFLGVVCHCFPHFLAYIHVNSFLPSCMSACRKMSTIFSTKIPYVLVVSPLLATYPTHCIYTDLHVLKLLYWNYCVFVIQQNLLNNYNFLPHYNFRHFFAIFWCLSFVLFTKRYKYRTFGFLP